MDRPETFTADRADQVTEGMLIHLARPLLSEEPPAEGWVSVSAVESGVSGVLLELGDGTARFFAGDTIVFQGQA